MMTDDKDKTATAMKKRSRRQAGNAIVMLFAAIGMAGVVTYGLNNIMRGPGVTSAELSRRTIAENNLIASTRLAVASATTQAAGGDCDGDGFVEPVPYRDAGALPKPAGGGLLPMTIGASMTDPWNAQYGYCVWDPGTASVPDNVAACGGSTAKRLKGSLREDQPALAVISAGKNGAFETSCAAYLDANNDSKPDVPMVATPAGSDDVVLAYTYAEANGIGGGQWKLKTGDATTATIAKNLNVAGGASFTGTLQLQNKGLVLPGDPGDNTITGACNEIKQNQMRRNTSTSPPTLEICAWDGASGTWTAIGSGGTAAVTGFNPNLGNCTANHGGPLAERGAFNTPDYAQGVVATKDYVFVADRALGLEAYTYDGANFTHVGTNFAPASTTITELYYDGTYLFALDDSNNKIYALTFNGTSFTQLGSYTFPAAPKEITGTTGNIFVTAGTSGLYALSFNGTAFNVVATSTAVANAYGVYFDGTYIYAGDSFSNIKAFSLTGGTLTLRGTSSSINSNGLMSGNGAYVYVANGASGLRALTFDGTTFTVKGNITAASNIGIVWTDGTTVFAGAGTALNAYSFNGTAFALLNSVTTPDIVVGIKGDGNYVYIGDWNSGGIRAYSGFECMSPDPAGGFDYAAAADAAPSNLPDPLDKDLVSHWKIDGQGGPIIDSVGTNTGTLVNSPEWDFEGVDGGGSIVFRASDYDRVLIPGHLGDFHQGTIAGWVNIESSNLVATVMSIGGGIMFINSTVTGLSLTMYDGSTTYRSATGTNITGTGWHYVAATYDDVAQRYRVYIDGKIRADSLFTGTISFAGNANSFFGPFGNGAGTEFTGALDNFRFYKTALSPDQVIALSKREMAASRARLLAHSTASNDMYGRITASGDVHSCGIKADNTLWCWGAPYGSYYEQVRYYLSLPVAGVSIGYAPYRIRDTVRTVFFPTATASDISGGNVLAAATGSNFSISSPKNSTSSTSFYTPAYQPSVVSEGPMIIQFYPNAGVSASLYGSVFVSRISASGRVKGPELQIGVEQNLATAKVYAWTGSPDFGTWSPGDRLQLRLQLRNAGGTDLTPVMNGASGTAFSATSAEPETSLWKQVVAGRDNVCGIKVNGTLWCWGDVTGVRVAGGTTYYPIQIDGGGSWTKISLARYGAYGGGCGIKTDGSGWCWGSATNGTNGNGGGSSSPGEITGSSKWVDISKGQSASCGIKTDGSLWCWGTDNNGILGNGPAVTAQQNAPYAVSEPGPWVSVSVADFKACAVKADGSAWCWGQDSSGVLGNGTSLTADQDSPSRVADPGRFTQIAVASYSACALKVDGSAWCWGYDNGGSLGNGPSISADQASPSRVLSQVPFKAIDVSYGHVCAITAASEAWCWGGNTGYGSAALDQADAPVPVFGFPNAPGWGWNDAATIIMAPYKTNIALGQYFMTDTSSTAQGFGFTAPGRAVLRQLTTNNNQFLISSTAASTVAQTSFQNVASSVTDVTTGLVAKWLLDETSGTTAAAAVGTIAGTLVGGPIWTPNDGRNGGAAYFGGSSYIQTPGSSAVLKPAAITVATWVKRDGIGTQPSDHVVTKAYNGNTTLPFISYSISINSSATQYPRLAFSIGYSTSGGGNVKAYSPYEMPNNTWQYVVGTYQPSDGFVRLYVDGAMVSQTALSSAILYDNTVLRFGEGGNTTPGEYHKGGIDDVRIYNRVLSATEVKQLYDYQTSTFQKIRSMGVIASTGNFEVSRNTATATAINTLTPDLAIKSTGEVGIGTNAPAAALDVAGAVKIGTDNTPCVAGKSGAVRFTGTTYEYCNGTAWGAFAGSSPMLWQRGYSKLSVGANFVCGVKANGTVWCWGSDGSGELGNGTAVTATQTSPYAITGSATWTQINGKGQASCGLQADGTAWCWGFGTYGGMGNGSSASQESPVPVSGGGTWKTVQNAGSTGCGIKSTGDAWCWGLNSGQLGNNTTANTNTPVQVHTDTASPGWYDWVDISLNNGNTCGIRTDGSLWCWGRADVGTNGNNDISTQMNRPSRVGTAGTSTLFSDWVSISNGLLTACGLRSNGTVWCWGWNSNGQIGNNTTTQANVPTQVLNSAGGAGWADWVSISAGSQTTCGIRTNGTAWCWGFGSSGQLGNNGTANSSLPQQVLSSGCGAAWSDWATITTGGQNTCGTRVNGTQWCWGQAYWGSLGDGQTATNRLCPVAVN